MCEGEDFTDKLGGEVVATGDESLLPQPLKVASERMETMLARPMDRFQSHR